MPIFEAVGAFCAQRPDTNAPVAKGRIYMHFKAADFKHAFDVADHLFNNELSNWTVTVQSVELSHYESLKEAL